MAIVTTDSKHYTDIAEAIRAKGVSGSFKPNQMAAAIESIEGGGGTEITDGIVVKSRNADGSPAEIDYYGSTVAAYQFGFNGYGTRCNPFSLITKVNFKRAFTTSKNSVFTNASNLTSLLIPDNVIFNLENSWGAKCTALKTIEILSESTFAGYSIFDGCVALETFYAPKMTDVNATSNTNYAAFKGCGALRNAQFGSVGYGVTRFTNAVFNNEQSNLTITIYTTAGYADTALANARNGAPNATIIIKDSTTGEVIVTNTPT